MSTKKAHDPHRVNPSRRSMLGCGGALVGGAALGQMIPAALAAEHIPAPSHGGATFDVRRFGARGDGQADDTAAAQAAIDAALAAKGGCIHFSAGRYRITRSLKFAAQVPVDVTGAGYSTILLHENAEPVLVWPEHVSCVSCSVRSLQITSVKQDKPPDVPAVACLGGAERSTLFAHLLFSGDGATVGSAVRVDRVADTLTFLNCLLWGITGIGLQLAQGAEARIIGGRITGIANDQTPVKTAPRRGIGILLTGNQGGVHIVTTDIIALETGMQIGTPEGPMNREIFITHATFDSCIRGLWIRNAGYVSVAGCWAASSDGAQIVLDSPTPAVTPHGCLLVVSGGTISNGGAYGRENTSHGLVARAGSFVLSGVTFWHNKGTAILVEGEGVADYAITGCQIRDNGVGASLRGQRYVCAHNVFASNGTQLVAPGGESAHLESNVFHPPRTG